MSWFSPWEAVLYASRGRKSNLITSKYAFNLHLPFPQRSFWFSSYLLLSKCHAKGRVRNAVVCVLQTVSVAYIFGQNTSSRFLSPVLFFHHQHNGFQWQATHQSIFSPIGFVKKKNPAEKEKAWCVRPRRATQLAVSCSLKPKSAVKPHFGTALLGSFGHSQNVHPVPLLADRTCRVLPSSPTVLPTNEPHSTHQRIQTADKRPRFPNLFLLGGSGGEKDLTNVRKNAFALSFYSVAWTTKSPIPQCSKASPVWVREWTVSAGGGRPTHCGRVCSSNIDSFLHRNEKRLVLLICHFLRRSRKFLAEQLATWYLSKAAWCANTIFCFIVSAPFVCSSLVCHSAKCILDCDRTA